MQFRSGLLAVALGSCLYLWEEESGSVSAFDNSEIVSAIHWLNGSGDKRFIRGVLAIATEGGTVSLWDPVSQKTLRSFSLSIGNIFEMSSCAYILSLACPDCVVHIDIRSREQTPVLSLDRIPLSSLAWRQDGEFVAYGSGSSVLVWGRETLLSPPSSPFVTYSGHAGTIQSIVWCGWQPNVMASSDHESIHLWNAMSGFTIRKVSSSNTVILFWGPDSYLTSIQEEPRGSSCSIFSVPSLCKVAECRDQVKGISGSAFDTDTSRLITLGSDERIQFKRISAQPKGPAPTKLAAPDTPTPKSPTVSKTLFSPESRRTLFFLFSP